MANPDRLTALDSTFLHLEDHSTAHMHVASVMVFEGAAPTLQELVEHVESRLHLVPRYRQRLAYVPLGQGRPMWTDDPHFNPYYHIRHTALPKPADDSALKRLAGRLFSQRLDRSKPLWEIWLVQSMSRGRFALIAKTHHALVDGISGVDITTVLFDTAREPAPASAPRERRGAPSRCPGPPSCSARRCIERTTMPGEMARGARAMLRAPRRAAAQLKDALESIGATTLAGINAPAPPSPFNVEIGPHRRYTFLDADLARVQGDQGLARRHAQRRRARLRHARARALPARPRPRHRGARAEGDGARVGAPQVRPRRARQPGRGDVGAAAGRRREPSGLPAQDRRGDGGAQALRSGGGRTGPHQPRGVRAAHDPQPGRAPQPAPAVLQPRGNQRSRPAVPALPARPSPRGALPGGPARAEARRSASPS